MRKYTEVFAQISLIILILSIGIVHADDGPTHDQTHNLAKASQNPISSLVSVPFEFNNNFNTRPEDAYERNS